MDRSPARLGRLGHLGALVLLAAALMLSLAACAGDEVGSDDRAQPGDPGATVASTSQAMTTSEILTRADDYVAANVPYCGGVRGGTDYICGGTCQRPAAPWDHYRSDCSGFVSWCWQIASDPTTSGYMTDTAGANGWHSVAIDDLAAGDAVVCDGHIKLFSKLVTAGSAEIYEEYNCGHVAHKAVQTFTRSGDTLKFAYDSRVYHGIRRNGLTAPVPAPPSPAPAASSAVKGAIDSAARSVAGWAVDLGAKSAALTVEAYFDGDPASGFRVEGKASLPRPDVATTLGVDPNHGFSIVTPLYFCDGSAHSVTVLGTPADGKSAKAPLGKASQPVTCVVPPARPGVLRHVADPASLAAWKLDERRSLRWMTADDRAAYEVVADLPAQPRIGRTSDGAVWLVDGASRRPIGSAASVADWSIDAAKVGELTPAEAALPVGLPLSSRPVLVRALGTPEIYLLDVDPANPVDPAAEAPEDADLASSGRRGALAGAGCGIARGAGSPGAALGGALTLALALAAARRRARAR
jgi:hypothetical protein